VDIPAGGSLVVEFHTDANADNDGAGFRLQWQCDDYRTPLY
jgi:hypothetical protein